MTPAERALLLAVAKEIRGEFYGPESKSQDLISAVEAEAAFAADDEAELAEVAAKAMALYEVPPTVCPTCDGGRIYLKRTQCPDCNGAGKKEKTDDHT